MTVSNTPLMSRCRSLLLRKAVLWLLLVLFMVLAQSARGYNIAGSKLQFVQLCTQQGMVNVAVDAEPSASDMLVAHGGQCCGCCSVSLGAPPVIRTVEKIQIVEFISAASIEVRIPFAAFTWSPARPQPPPVFS